MKISPGKSKYTVFHKVCGVRKSAAFQREVLQLLMPGDWMPLLKLIPIGDRLLATLLQTGWIERSPDLKVAPF
jgi:hypothetical protein